MSLFLYIDTKGAVKDGVRIHRWTSGSGEDLSLRGHARLEGLEVASGEFGEGGYSDLVGHACQEENARSARQGGGEIPCFVRLPMPEDEDFVRVPPVIGSADVGRFGCLLDTEGAVVVRRHGEVQAFSLTAIRENNETGPLYRVRLPDGFSGSERATEKDPRGTGRRIPV